MSRPGVIRRYGENLWLSFVVGIRRPLDVDLEATVFRFARCLGGKLLYRADASNDLSDEASAKSEASAKLAASPAP